MKTRINITYPTFAAIAFACLALLPTARAGTPEPKVSENYGKLPLSFEANDGQQDQQVKFLSRGSGYELFLTNREAVLVLTKSEKPATPSTDNWVLSQKLKRQSIALRTRLFAPNPRAKVIGEQDLLGKVNYFIGNDPKKWRTNVQTYAKVRYEKVYPGIDLVYYGNQRQLEYDFVVRPGAEPARIRMDVAGARKMRVAKDGGLILQMAGGEVRWNKPLVYQEINGIRHAINGKYVLRRGHEIGFQVAAYDTAKPLIIDPTLVYSTYLGGSGDDAAYGIAVDTSGDAYVTGGTLSTDFPTTVGAFQTSNHGSVDVFVTRLNPTGTALLYSTYLGGSGSDAAGPGAITIDTAGNAYVVGFSDSTDFPTTAGAFQSTNHGGGFYFTDGFVTKLNPTGSLVYSTYLGGGGADYPQGVAVDASGNAYITGHTHSTDFPTTVGAFQPTTGNPYYDNGFVTKLNATGAALVYSTFLSGSLGSLSNSIEVDAAGNAYVAGTAVNFPITGGAFQATCIHGPYNPCGVVTKLDPSGSSLIYSTFLGGSGSGNDSANGIAVDASGNAYVTGSTTSTNFPTTTGAFQTTYGGSGNAFVAKFDPTGSTLLYSTYLGGTGGDNGSGIAVDASGQAWVTGYTNSTDFPTTGGAFQTTYGGGQDAFVTQLNPAGTGLLYSTYVGGSSYEVGNGIALDASSSAYVTGFTTSTNFPTTSGAFQTTLRGNTNAFVAKIATSVTISVSASPMGSGTASGGGTFPNGSTVTVTATPNSCYNFTNWTENNVVVSTSPTYSFIAGANRVLVANFTLAYAAQIQPPINSDGSSIFNANRGVVPVKFTLTLGCASTCNLPPASIALTRTAGGTTGSVNESVYSMPSDSGSNFRIDSCQYIYNLNSGALGVGTYRVDILINNQVVGSAVFQLR